jgi:hypothetical protein
MMCVRVTVASRRGPVAPLLRLQICHVAANMPGPGGRARVQARGSLGFKD